jgi:hypothetical protein
MILIAEGLPSSPNHETLQLLALVELFLTYKDLIEAGRYLSKNIGITYII